jgi:competence protein ComEA
MRRLVIVACAALLLVPVVIKSRTIQEIPDRSAFRAFSNEKILVKISGDVRHPGIYEVLDKSLAESAIKMAGPYRSFKSTINSRSAPTLRNGSAVTLTIQPDGLQLIIYGVMTVSERLVLRIPLDIETMTEADFDRLPGVGPALARRIIEYRQINGGILRVEDLEMIEGIGEKKFEMLRGYF